MVQHLNVPALKKQWVHYPEDVEQAIKDLNEALT